MFKQFFTLIYYTCWCDTHRWDGKSYQLPFTLKIHPQIIPNLYDFSGKMSQWFYVCTLEVNGGQSCSVTNVL